MLCATEWRVEKKSRNELELMYIIAVTNDTIITQNIL